MKYQGSNTHSSVLKVHAPVQAANNVSTEMARSLVVQWYFEKVAEAMQMAGQPGNACEIQLHMRM